MCGIIGYVGSRQAAPIVLRGLRRLEYRGYDSAGLAVVDHGVIALRRAEGRLDNLFARVDAAPPSGSTGIGHTRWATHGVPAERNAHPHASADGRFVVVHNGIVENYQELRRELIDCGVVFRSETDSEVIAHLIALYAADGAHGDLTEAVRLTSWRLHGAQAILALSADQPDRLVAARIGNAGGLAVGIGSDEHVVASDVTALVDHSREVVFIEDRQVATVTAQGCQVQTLDGAPRALFVHPITLDEASVARGDHASFMHKEIFEQPATLAATLAGRVDFERGDLRLSEIPVTAAQAQALRRVVIVACGTSYYSALVGKFYLEQLARIPVEVDYASEYRYRQPLADAQTLVVAITQSGETVDTLSAMTAARERHARLLAIVNTQGSQAARQADGCIPMRVGPEIGVASTKAFTASLVDLYLLALALAEHRGTLSEADRRQRVIDLMHLPNLVSGILAREDEIAALADRFVGCHSSLFLGRGLHYPIALEGALKLKEISYIHAEGYPAGEMKHGPIALLDETTPVVALAPNDALRDKMISQIEQVKARGATAIVLATENDADLERLADAVIALPPTPALLSPVVAVVPLQLLAYHVALARGCDVDRPRHLAKSVTVE